MSGVERVERKLRPKKRAQWEREQRRILLLETVVFTVLLWVAFALVS